MAANAWPTVLSRRRQIFPTPISLRSLLSSQQVGRISQAMGNTWISTSQSTPQPHISDVPTGTRPPPLPSIPIKSSPVFLPGAGNIYEPGSSSSSMASSGLSQHSWKIKPPRKKLSVPAEVAFFRAGSSCVASGSPSRRNRGALHVLLGC